MFKLWKKNKSEKNGDAGPLTWDTPAKQALEQAISQAPVPKMMKGVVRKQLSDAAEAQTRKAGRTSVTAQDLMNGLMEKLPANMRKQVEQAAKQGPQGLKNLEKRLKRK